MCQRYFDRRVPGSVAVAAALLALLVGCAGPSPRPAADRSVAQDGRDVEAPPANPALVEVDEGVGFTVTEVATITSDVRSVHQEALRHLAAGNARLGVELLLQVVDKAPDATGPYIDLGIAYGALGQHEEAVAALEKAVAATPDHPVAHNELGIALRRLGRFAEARASYERALAVYPGFHFARRNLAVLCDLYLADLSCALEHYEIYQLAAPEDAEVDMWLADLRNRASQ